MHRNFCHIGWMFWIVGVFKDVVCFFDLILLNVPKSLILTGKCGSWSFLHYICNIISFHSCPSLLISHHHYHHFHNIGISNTDLTHPPVFLRKIPFSVRRVTVVTTMRALPPSLPRRCRWGGADDWASICSALRTAEPPPPFLYLGEFRVDGVSD